MVFPKGSGTSPQSDYVLKCTKLKHTVCCFTIHHTKQGGAAAEPTPGFCHLRSRPRAALSRAPGPPPPAGLPLGIPRRRPCARRGSRAPPGAAG